MHKNKVSFKFPNARTPKLDYLKSISFKILTCKATFVQNFY